MIYEIYNVDTGEILDTLNGFPVSVVQERADEYFLQEGIPTDYRKID